MAIADRTISTVLHDIVGNIQHIVRSEMRLAKTELTEELQKSRAAATLLAVGAVLLSFGVLFVLLAAVYALSGVVPSWAAALIVGAVVALIAGVFVGAALKKFKTVRAAPKTVDSMKENMEWARQPTR
jgi:uncharacterized membrane protein YqjE